MLTAPSPATSPALCHIRLAAHRSALDAQTPATRRGDFMAFHEARLDTEARWSDFVRSLEPAGIVSEAAAKAAGLGWFVDVATGAAVPIP